MNVTSKTHCLLAAVVAIVAVLAGVAFRIAGAFGELWLDEVWSIEAARSLGSALGVFTSPRLDGHSSLYTALVFVLGPGLPAAAYRLFAVLCGIGSLPLVYLLSRGRPCEERLLGVSLFSLSYLIVLYGSEARGYAPMILFGLLSLVALERTVRHPSVLRGAAFAAASIAAFLFHYTYLQLYAAAAVWTVYLCVRDNGRWSGLKRACLIHLTPVVFFAGMYLLVIRHLPPGSGPLRSSYFDPIVNAVSITFGGPLLSPLRPELGIATCLGCLAILYLLWTETFRARREGDDRWLLFVLAVFIMPAAFLLAMRPRVLVERYFLTASVLAYPLLARVIVGMSRRSRAGACAAAGLAGLFVAGNLSYDLRFLAYGRGSYGGVIEHTVARGNKTPPVLTGDHDFRHRMMLGYFGADRVEYHEGGLSFGPPAEWHVTSSQDPWFTPDPELPAGENGLYRLEQTLPFTALSGSALFLYRLEPAR